MTKVAADEARTGRWASFFTCEAVDEGDRDPRVEAYELEEPIPQRTNRERQPSAAFACLGVDAVMTSLGGPMRIRTLTLALSTLLGHALAPARAQSPLVAPRAVPAICTEAVVRDATDPVWQAIEAQYAKLADAMRRKDLDALFALYTPDYHVVMNNGEIWSRERSLEYQRSGLARVRETHHISNSIVRLTACDGHATATVLQQWYRTQMMGGVLRRVETNAVQDEAWSLTPDGWKRGNIAEIHGGASFVDGKRVDISKPYDPNAPAYDPDASARRD